MNVHIYSHHPAITETIRSQTIALIRRTLEQFGNRVVDVTVHLRKAHGTRGEVHTHCRLLATVTASRQVMVERIHVDQEKAIAQASIQLAQAVQDSMPERCDALPCTPPTARIEAARLFRRQPSVAVPTRDSHANALPPTYTSLRLLT